MPDNKKTIKQLIEEAKAQNAESSAPEPSSQDYENAIYKTVKDNGYSDNTARLIVAQAKHESDDFDSDVFGNTNNPFGMTYGGQSGASVSGVSKQPDSEGGTPYASYNSIEDATKDLLSWHKRREEEGKYKLSELDSPQRYAHAIRNAGYYTDPESVYANGMSRYYNQGHKTIVQLIQEAKSANDQKKSPDASATGSAQDSQPIQDGSYGNSQGMPTSVANILYGGKQIDPATNLPVAPALPYLTQHTQTEARQSELENPELAQQKTANAAHYLSSYLVNAASKGQLSEYANNLKNVPLSDPNSVAHNVSDPHGDPSWTGGFVQHAVASLEQQKEAAKSQIRSQFAVQQANTPVNLGTPVMGAQNPALPQNQLNAKLAEVDKQFNSQIQPLKENAAHILSLQLFNKDYTEKALTQAEANTQIQALEKDKEDALKAAREKLTPVANSDSFPDAQSVAYKDEVRKINKHFSELQSSIINNTKYNPIRLGAEQAAQMGDAQAKDDVDRLTQGLPIDPRRQYQYNLAGNNIIQVGTANTINETAKKEGAAHADIEGKQLFENNKPYILTSARQQIGNIRYKDENGLLHAVVPSFAFGDLSPQQIQQYGEQSQIPQHVIDEVKKEPGEIPKSASIWQQGMGAAINSAAPIYERAVRSAAALAGVPSEDVDARFYPGWENEQGIAPLIVGNIPSDQNSFKNIRGAIGHIVEGVAGLVMLTGEVGAVAKGLEGLGVGLQTADKAANFGVMALNGYNNAYKQSKDIIGDKPENEIQRQAYAILSGVAEGAIFSIHSPTKLLTEGLQNNLSAGEKLINALKNTSLEGADAYDAFHKEYTNYIVQFAKNMGTQISLADANKIAHNGLDIAFGKKDKKITEGLGDESVSTALAMFIPSIIGAVGHTEANTPLNAAVMFDAGSKPEAYKAELDNQLADGKITQQQHATISDAFNRMGQAIKSTPVQNADGAALTPDQVKSYAFNLFQEGYLQQRLKSLQDGSKMAGVEVDKAQATPLTSKISELVSQRDQILKDAGKGKPPIKMPAEVAQPNGAIATAAPKEATGDATKEKNTENISELGNENISSQSKTDDHGIHEESSQQTSIQQTPNEGETGQSESSRQENGSVRQEGGPSRELGPDQEQKNEAGAETPAIVVSGKLSAKERKAAATKKAQEAIEHTIEPDFHAVKMGELDGKPEEEAKPLLEKTGLDEKIGGTGETPREAITRVKDAWEKFKDKAQDNTLAIQHSGVMKIIEAGEQHGWDNTEKIWNDYLIKPEPETGEIRRYQGKNGEIAVTRHAESKDGAAGLMRREDTPLTPEGKREAAEDIPAALKKEGVAPSVIVSDEQPRTHHTAEIVQENLSPSKTKAKNSIDDFLSENKLGYNTDGQEHSDGSRTVGIHEDMHPIRDSFAAYNKEENKKLKKLKADLELGDITRQEYSAKLNELDKEVLARAAKENALFYDHQEAIKSKENASTQSKEQQQESVQQGGESEHARTEQTGGEAAPTETKSGDSDVGSKEKEEINSEQKKRIAKRYSKVADAIREIGDKATTGSQGMLFTAPPLTGKIFRKLAHLVADGVEKFGHLHLAFIDAWNKISKEHNLGDVTLAQIKEIESHFEHLADENPTAEPTFSGMNGTDRQKSLAEAAKDWADASAYEILEKESTYDDVVKELHEHPYFTEAQKGEILHYIDWNIHDKSADNKLAAYNLKDSGLSDFLGAETTKDIVGEGQLFDDPDEKKNAIHLNDLMDDAKKITERYKESGNPASQWGAKMLSDIKEISSDPKKQGTAIAGLHIELQDSHLQNQKGIAAFDEALKSEKSPEKIAEIQKQRLDLINENNKLGKVIADVQNFGKKLASTASDVLNTRRLDRMLRDDLLSEYYHAKILSEQEQRRQKQTEDALNAKIIEDYKNHPQYKKDMDEQKRSEARKKREQTSKESTVEKAKKKVTDVVKRLTGRKPTEKERVEKAKKAKEEAQKKFPRDEKGNIMTPEQFLEYIKKLKNPCE